MAETCWVLTRTDGTHIDNGDYVEHFDTEAKAAQRVADHHADDYLTPGCYANGTPRQLDQPCLTVTCGCCGEEYDEDGEGYTVHFRPGETSLVTEAEWTERPDGSYRCPVCSPGGDLDCENCRPEREAVASRG
jgi:hypothetical protein